MIIWLNGSFSAGKTTLAEQLHRRLPTAIVYDPEQVGLLLWKFVPRNDDFQDLPSWRELVVATALSLRRHHASTLIVPMSLIDDGYRDEIMGGLTGAGEPILHVFLRASREVLLARHRERAAPPENPAADGLAWEWARTRIQAAVAAADRQPAGTVMLDSGKLSPAQLADRVLAEVTARADEPSPHRGTAGAARRYDGGG